MLLNSAAPNCAALQVSFFGRAVNVLLSGCNGTLSQKYVNLGEMGEDRSPFFSVFVEKWGKLSVKGPKMPFLARKLGEWDH